MTFLNTGPQGFTEIVLKNFESHAGSIDPDNSGMLLHKEIQHLREKPPIAGHCLLNRRPARDSPVTPTVFHSDTARVGYSNALSKRQAQHLEGNRCLDALYREL